MLCNLGEKVITDLDIPLVRNNLPGLVSNIPANAKSKFERKISRKSCVREGKEFTLFISNEDMNDIIKIIKPLEDSNVLIDSIIETVKHEIKKQEGGFLRDLLASLAASLVQPNISSVVKNISERRVIKAGRGYMDKIF